jgi:hypothetical protein
VPAVNGRSAASAAVFGLICLSHTMPKHLNDLVYDFVYDTILCMILCMPKYLNDFVWPWGAVQRQSTEGAGF